ncbi:MAG TPA: hypothetical protein PLL00_14550, partial [Bacteroidia bacterium]|nr:hypothetical protein [Bacteroidia bacterium]
MIKSSTLSFLFLFVFLNTGKAQVFWTERFEKVCSTQCKVDSYTTGPNAVDSIRLSTTAVSIITGPILTSPICGCGVVEVPYDGTGLVFKPGNKFTAELSDANGSFANPIGLGFKPGTTVTGSITANIRCDIPPGTGYRIRVTSSDTASIGTDNGVDLKINPPLVITATPNPDTVCVGSKAVIKGLGGDPKRYEWYEPPKTVPDFTDDSLVIFPTTNKTYILWGRVGPDYGCIDSTTVKIVVQPKPVVSVTDTARTCVGLGAVLKATGGTKYLWGNGSTKDSLVVFPTKDTMVVVSITKGYCTIKDT